MQCAQPNRVARIRGPRHRLAASALARLEAGVLLVDDVGAAAAADDAAVLVALLQGLEGIADLHGHTVRPEGPSKEARNLVARIFPVNPRKTGRFRRIPAHST